MISFSANLGFLWTDLPLPEAIHAAGAAGFDAVECHMPYAYEASTVAAALEATGLNMVSMNTTIGDREGDLGLAAVPGREDEARAAIDQALDYAGEIGCRRVSVVAGKTGRTEEAEATYRKNLEYAATKADVEGQIILIEPLNTDVAEDYHLVSADAGAETIRAIDAANIQLMIDCFHTRKMDGEIKPVFRRVMPFVGHVQISAFPDRGEPVDGDPENRGIKYSDLLPWLVERGYRGEYGAEYTPAGNIDEGLTWLEAWGPEERAERNR